MSNTAVPIKPIARGQLAKLWIGLALLVLLGAAAAWAGTRGMGIETTPSGLRYQVLKAGTGASPTEADVALIQYEGRLAATGAVFDSTEQKGPQVFPVAGSIPGFTEGLKLMQKGGKYRLFIPAELGYGAQGVGPIPANADLEFDVTLVEFQSMAALEAAAAAGRGGAGGGMPPGM